jgi:homoserine dehydrogenase
MVTIQPIQTASHTDTSANACQQVTPVTIGMIGFGTVGGGVMKLLERHDNVKLVQIAVRDVAKAQKKLESFGLESFDMVSQEGEAFFTTSPMDVVTHPDIQMVVEVMGGIDPAYELVATALRHGKHVVTANKALIATRGAELFQIAQEQGVSLLLEAAVCAGVPLIAPLRNSLRANHIEEIAGIVNGTTNYMLTRMSEEQWHYDEALRVAQEKGFAEADPTSDVDGFDTAYKMSILASIAFSEALDPEKVHKEGIRGMSQQDIKLARQLGYVIKLIGLARLNHAEKQADLRVHPMLIRADHPLASIHNEYNAVWVRGDAVGEVMFSGRGAGEMPTASGVCSDILSVVQAIQEGNSPRVLFSLGNACAVMGQAHQTPVPITYVPVAETVNEFYVRLTTVDRSGVVGLVGNIFGEHGVSIKMLMQPESSEEGATLVLITHSVKDAQLRHALAQLQSLGHDVIQAVNAVYRVHQSF